jgi:diguanylate cyclase (GGDEF)-like protein/PAS domain S-box-containing protein
LYTPISPPTALLIDNDPSRERRIRKAIASGDNESYHVQWVRNLSEGLTRLESAGIAAILLSLSLPDSKGIETFEKLFAIASGIPILILGGRRDKDLAREAMGKGAQDFLLPSHLRAYPLQRALSNAIERKAIEDALYIEKERAQVTLNSIGDAVLCTDIAGKVSYLNLMAETLTGWASHEAIGRPTAEVFQIIDGESRVPARDPMEMAIAQNRTVGLTTNCVLIRRDGHESAIEDSAAPIHDRKGGIVGAVIVFHDVTLARNISRQMTHLAQHDTLTNLANRLLLCDRMSQAIALGHRQNRSVGILFLDLDHFKCINDSLGHPIGDKLLVSVSKRLLSAVRASDTISRQGGDEFVILLSDIAFPEDAAASARKILLSLNAPHRIAGQSLHIAGSIGISVYPADGEDAETLLRNADTAMYHAKQSGRNNFQFFENEMNLKALERQSIESTLHAALSQESSYCTISPESDSIPGRSLEWKP